ncbi:DUF4381 domain-containing protein [Aestuariirhabdus sp. Z084]|uniref:DUF4381 domain-containing protein n=1 Tax=Aestuariirhabdus haliotis TaxID=2918751 RepID=UPI00201B37D0|nr:DUF4381 domain-containing protein [Aestuariirhabdus haliotis]MCL6414617.1 DUF4381 domain-containing protein [Aestuariirhabdus haliotis]MCL6418401.1 DUF4381 domain-containing protein [Aestuariirhabdus haliotis]
MDNSALLKQLDPIIEPVAINPYWPLAPGWYLLALGILLVLFAIHRLIKKRQRRIARQAYRQQARQQLERQWQLYQQQPDKLHLVETCNQLLKQVAIQAYDSSSVAGLQGESWWAFLQQSLPNENSQEAKEIEQSRYQPGFNTDPAAFYYYCIKWVEHHES